MTVLRLKDELKLLRLSIHKKGELRERLKNHIGKEDEDEEETKGNTEEDLTKEEMEDKESEEASDIEEFDMKIETIHELETEKNYITDMNCKQLIYSV